jgi:hypothetical protein
MKNVHTRELSAPIESLRPWIEACWSGTADDAFPRDVIRSWRQNPAGIAPLALVPNVTRVGHGFLSFRFESWDGRRFWVRVENDAFRGGHGFDLESTERGCRITHTIEVALIGRGRILWPLMEPIHDWVVEAMFDRIEVALRTGVMPQVTHGRKMNLAAASAFTLFRRVNRFRSASRSRARQTT